MCHCHQPEFSPEFWQADQPVKHSLSPLWSILTRTQGRQATTNCKMSSRDQKTSGRVFRADYQSFRTSAYVLLWVTGLSWPWSCPNPPVRSVAADKAGVKWDESHWLRLGTWSWEVPYVGTSWWQGKETKHTHKCLSCHCMKSVEMLVKGLGGETFFLSMTVWQEAVARWGWVYSAM